MKDEDVTTIKNIVKVSVLITAYNGEKYIGETIKSVLEQDFKEEFEIVIIDDGSTDNTKKIIKSFDDKRILYYYFGKNKGYFNLHNVVNFGMKRCNGKYIARIDADDVMYKDRLRIQYNYLEKHKGIYMIGSSFNIIDSEGRFIETIKKRNYPSFLFKYHIAVSNSFLHSSIMFRNTGIEYPSYNEHMFYVYLVFLGKKIKNIKNVLVKYRLKCKTM